jgi:hypothetical protein
LYTIIYTGAELAALEINLLAFKHCHLSLLKELLTSQKSHLHDIVTMKTLPKIGYIALLGDHPIAAGFLRKVEPCYAQIDTLASNANFGSKIRHQGITLVVNSLMEDAKRLKLEGIIAFTGDSGVLKRAGDQGFHVIPQTIIVKRLEY